MEAKDDQSVSEPVNEISISENECSSTSSKLNAKQCDSTTDIAPTDQSEGGKVEEEGAVCKMDITADGSDSDVEIIEDKISTIYISDTDSSDERQETKIEQLLEKCRLQSEIESVRLDMEVNGKEPFVIDFKIIPVDIYQEALHYNIWSPTTILYEICQKSQWDCPKFQVEDYVPTEGFLCSIKINGRKFLSQWRSRTPSSAKCITAAFFLKIIGFKINIESLNLFSDWTHLNEFNTLAARRKLESNLLSRKKSFTKSAAVDNSYKCKNQKYDRLFSNSMKRMFLIHDILSHPKRGKITSDTETCKARMLKEFFDDLNECSTTEKETPGNLDFALYTRKYASSGIKNGCQQLNVKNKNQIQKNLRKRSQVPNYQKNQMFEFSQRSSKRIQRPGIFSQSSNDFGRRFSFCQPNSYYNNNEFRNRNQSFHHSIRGLYSKRLNSCNQTYIRNNCSQSSGSESLSTVNHTSVNTSKNSNVHYKNVKLEA